VIISSTKCVIQTKVSHRVIISSTKCVIQTKISHRVIISSATPGNITSIFFLHVDAVETIRVS
jgi:hypothetical protein